MTKSIKNLFILVLVMGLMLTLTGCGFASKAQKLVDQFKNGEELTIEMITDKQQNYQELLVQHKALKALQFRKKSAVKEQMIENLVMQYAIRAYLGLLLKNGRYEKPLEKDEIVFFKAFEKVVDGKKLSTSDKVKIRDYIMEHYRCEIKQLRECDYASVLNELQNKQAIMNAEES